MIRVAAVGDVHFGTDSAGTLRPHLADLADQADVFLLAGDLTRRGLAEEAQVLADELAGVGVPMFAVLGNHDYHSVQEHAVTKVMEGAGVRVLEGDGVVVDVGGCRVGDRRHQGLRRRLRRGVRVGVRRAGDEVVHRLHPAPGRRAGGGARRPGRRRCDLRVALLHYSPTDRTLKGERLEIYPFLGSYLLGEAVDRAGADLVLHGHAHAGTRAGLDRRRHRGPQRGPTPHRPPLQRVLPAPPGAARTA